MGFFSSPQLLSCSYTDSAVEVCLKLHIYMRRLRLNRSSCSSINCSHWRKPLSARPLTFPATFFWFLLCPFDFLIFVREQKIIYSQKKIKFKERKLNKSKWSGFFQFWRKRMHNRLLGNYYFVWFILKRSVLIRIGANTIKPMKSWAKPQLFLCIFCSFGPVILC